MFPVYYYLNDHSARTFLVNKLSKQKTKKNAHEWGNVNLTLKLKVQLGVTLDGITHMKRLQFLCFAVP